MGNTRTSPAANQGTASENSSEPDANAAGDELAAINTGAASEGNEGTKEDVKACNCTEASKYVCRKCWKKVVPTSPGRAGKLLLDAEGKVSDYEFLQ